jgi:uncharacterized protein YeaO (DUF488 family)
MQWRSGMVKLKRAYEPATRGDGYRVLVDRLWPRGIRKQDLPLDAWAREIAPSTELRQWFHHDPDRWREFQQRYRRELKGGVAKERLRKLADRAEHGVVTLVFSAKDAEHSNAAVVRDLLARSRPVR